MLSVWHISWRLEKSVSKRSGDNELSNVWQFTVAQGGRGLWGTVRFTAWHV